jgi:acyl-coenzyme A synthetase/AMP-(fatty) acid ligase
MQENGNHQFVPACTNLAAAALVPHAKDRPRLGRQPREIEFVEMLPKTRSGNIQRDQLRKKRELNAEKVFIIE